MAEYTLVQDEPWIFLDIRRNPVNGRKLTFQLTDGTIVEIDVTMQEYHVPETIRMRLQAEIEAHQRLTGL